MDYEKKYKDALERAKKLFFTKREVLFKRQTLESIFPELKESEDERIRKMLLELAENCGEANFKEVTRKQTITWLEKQGEQKPAEWKPQPEALEALMYAIEGKWEMIKPTSYLSRRLEDLYDGLVNTYSVDEKQKEQKSAENLSKEEYVKRFKTLCDDHEIKIPNHAHEIYHLCHDLPKLSIDTAEQKTAEWSEEDERIRKAIIGYIDHGQHYDVSNKDMIAWLEKQSEQNPEWNKKPCLTCQEYDNGYKQGYTEGYNKAVKEAEQKSAEWSKNDTIYLNEIIDFFENKTVKLQHDLDMYAHWLKSLPERFVLEPKQEWSEEDEKMRYFVTEAVQIRYSDGELAKYLNPKIIKEKKQLKQKLFDWLRDLCPSYKPSEDTQELLHKEYERGYKDGLSQYQQLPIWPDYPAPYPGYPVYSPYGEQQWTINTSDTKTNKENKENE